MSRPEVEDHLPAFVEKMQNEGPQPLVIDTFAYYYNQVVTGETGLVFDREIQPLEPHEIEDFNNLKKICRCRPARSGSIRPNRFKWWPRNDDGFNRPQVLN